MKTESRTHSIFHKKNRKQLVKEKHEKSVLVVNLKKNEIGQMEISHWNNPMKLQNVTLSCKHNRDIETRQTQSPSTKSRRSQRHWREGKQYQFQKHVLPKYLNSMCGYQM